MIVSTMMASCWEGSPKKAGIIIHDSDAARAQSKDLEAPRVKVEEEINNSPPTKSSPRAH